MNTMRFTSKRIIFVTNDNNVSAKINRAGKMGIDFICTYKEIGGQDYWCVEIDKDFSKLEKILACGTWENV